MLPFDLNQSLQDLEGEEWDEPTFDSHLVTECHRLHRVPLRDFTVEDMRIMIGQHFSLEFLIPLALERLRQEPLAEGAFYPGDLLAVVLRAGAAFWQRCPDFRDGPGRFICCFAFCGHRRGNRGLRAVPKRPDASDLTGS